MDDLQRKRLLEDGSVESIGEGEAIKYQVKR